MQPRDMNDSAEDLVDPIQHSAHLSTAPSLRVETAALNLSSALIGARKRKALRVVKHQVRFFISYLLTLNSPYR